MNRSEQRQPTRNRLLLVDIENLSGVAPTTLDAAQVQELVAATRSFLAWQPGDDVVVACNPAWRFAVEGAWRGTVVRTRPGRDGADIELVEVMTPKMVGQYREVWIASGDGRLATGAAVANACGVPVTVVARPGCLSNALRRRADQVVSFVWREREEGSAA